MKTCAIDEGKLGDTCPVCGASEFIDRKLKRYCKQCGNLCETCCDGGRIHCENYDPNVKAKA